MTEHEEAGLEVAKDAAAVEGAHAVEDAAAVEDAPAKDALAKDAPTKDVPAEGEAKPAGRKGVALRRLRNALVGLVVAVALAAIASTFLIQVVEVRGSTMEPELSGGQYAFVLRGHTFERGDVAAFSFDNKTLIKRVVAVGGDTVDVKPDGTIFLNGEELMEPYATYLRAAASAEDEEGMAYPYVVPANSYFAVGDNRTDVSDSRNPAIAALPETAAVGRVILSL